LEVAIELGLREKQVENLFREFWKLKRQYRLYQIYPEIEHSLPGFLKLYSALKKRGLNPDNVEWFANAMETGAIKLPELQGQYQSLQNKVQTVHYQKQKLERDLQVIQRQIIELTDIEKLHQQNFDALTDNIYCLQTEKNKIEQFVIRFRNSNKKYLKIKSIAGEHVNRLLTEQGGLLTSALLAVIEALRLNPDRYAVIYNTKYDNNDSGSSTAVVEVPYSSSSSSSSPYPKPYQNYYYNEYHEGILEIAKTFFNGLLNQLVNKTMVAAVKENV
jgi:hypothetical protein